MAATLDGTVERTATSGYATLVGIKKRAKTPFVNDLRLILRPYFNSLREIFAGR
jgi:hypothetical protein